MSAKDRIHGAVKNALIKDAWKITHDPYVIELADRSPLQVDLAAERVFAAEKENQFIAVEAKSFLGNSEVNDLHAALGQYMIYHELVALKEPFRQLYLAVPEHAYDGVFTDSIGKIVLSKLGVRVIVVDVLSEEIIRWLS